MQYEDDYERRLAYIQRRRQERKRQYKIRMTVFFMVLGIVIIAACMLGWYFLEKKKYSKADDVISPTPARETPGNEPLETLGADPLEGTAGTAAEIILDEPASGIEQLLADAKALADTYDYDGAIALLQEHSDHAAIQESIASYEEIKSTLVRADINSITHIFFHSIIMDNQKAFDGDEDEKGYNQVMTTKNEFLKILEQMYERGYVLVRMHDIAYEETGEDGQVRMVEGNIMLPPGKKPFVMSQDDVCYYEYMKGDGFATRMIVGEDGKPTCEMTMDDGSVSVGSYDLVPLLEDFIQEHPDFSYRGARAVIAFTGYEGILGYRTDPDFADKNENFEQDKETVKQVVQCLRDNGWELASHSYGHIRMSTRSLEDIQKDTEKWEAYVKPLLGETDILLYPFGADINDWHAYNRENAKFAYLYDKGFRYFCNVDSNSAWVQMGSDYLRQGRRNLDGYRMYYDLPETNPTKDHLSDLFDVTTVFDRERPTPVPPMGGE